MLALLGATMLAMGGPAGEDCAMPPALEQRVCGDAELRALAAKLAEKEAAVARASSRPATWAARAAELRDYLATGEDYDDKPLDKPALAGSMQDRIDEIDVELARAAGIQPAADAAQILGGACLNRFIAHQCSVPQSGVIRGEDGAVILWQIQMGMPEQAPHTVGVMLWDATTPGAPRLIGWTYEGVWMRPPQYESETGLLWVPGTMDGTGSGNADILFQRRPDGWAEIETLSWRKDLDKRLPKGFGAWHGIDYDLTSLSGSTELWRDEDANCCATGGSAWLQFKLDGNAIKLDTIDAQIATGWKPNTEY